MGLAVLVGHVLGVAGLMIFARHYMPHDHASEQSLAVAAQVSADQSLWVCGFKFRSKTKTNF